MKEAGLRGAAPLVCGLLLFACGGKSSPTTVDIEMREWSLVPAVEETRGGRVRFEVTNTGSLPHELTVVRSDLPAAELPLVNGKVDSVKVRIEGQGGQLVAPGGMATLEMALSAGKYVLICSLADSEAAGSQSHYLKGMYAPFFVDR